MLGQLLVVVIVMVMLAVGRSVGAVGGGGDCDGDVGCG